MSNVFCKEFKGWCKAFTKTETYLLILEAVLIISFLAFLIFVIVHMIGCTSLISKKTPVEEHTVPTRYPKRNCSWTPSYKTAAVTQFYVTHTVHGNRSASVPSVTSRKPHPPAAFIDDVMPPGLATVPPGLTTSPPGLTTRGNASAPNPETYQYAMNQELYREEEEEEEEEPEEVEADERYQSMVMAVVKLRPPREAIFGCIVTVVAEYWVVTAASCIEAIEEVDSLDSFVMMEGFGRQRGGRTHVIADIQVHPSYGGVNRSYDLAALRSESRLVVRAQTLGGDVTATLRRAHLASLLDHLLVTLGERFTALGYGKLRSRESRPADRRLRAARVWWLPERACAGAGAGGGAGEEPWSHRHLVQSGALWREPPGRGAVCAGVLQSRRAPCSHCAGTPLLDGAVLLAVMSDNPQCSVTCEPTLYVAIAPLKDWIEAVVSD